MALPPNAVDKLNDTEQAVDDLVMNNLGAMPEGLNPEEQEEFMARQRAALQNAEMAAAVVGDAQEQVGEVLEDASGQLPVAASRRSFRLGKFAQGMGMEDPMQEPLPMDGAPGQQLDPALPGQPSFETHIDLYSWLEDQFGQGADVSEIRSQLISMAGESEIVGEGGLPVEPAEVIASGLTDYVEAINQDKPEERASIAKRIFDVMPQKDTSINEVSVVEQTVAETNGILRRLAIEAAKQRKSQTKTAGSGFNLSKTAQHKALDNVIMHMPGNNRIDPFTGYLISDWHVYERNKGWGLRAGDAIGIDYEAVWRGNVMDKYSRPYRDKDGNWVGGYIQKRFEVDKWIPETNNLQLKPGQKRKPYLAEYRSTESRLQHLRSEEDDRGRTFNDTSKPFNWKEASAGGKKKVTS